jgi:hypothetical protein
MDDLNDIRHRYAAEIEALANLQSEALATAFARVPREHFLGRGPWQILRPGIEDGDYRTTRDDDPVHLYQDVPVAIDPSRRLNKGYAAWFLSSVAVFHCIGSRNEGTNRRLREAMRRGAWGSVQSLRRDTHELSDGCWLHGDDFCLSTLPVLGALDHD